MDERLRDLEQQAITGDDNNIAVFLRALIRAGHLTVNDAKVLAWLNYKPAKKLFPSCFGKWGQLIKPGRDLLIVVLEEIFLQSFISQISASQARLLRRISHDLVENMQSPDAEDYQVLQELRSQPGIFDRFQRSALRSLASETSFSNLEQVSKRVDEICDLVIQSPFSRYYRLQVVDRTELRFGHGYSFHMPQWDAVDIQQAIVSRINHEIAVSFGPGPPSRRAWRTPLRDISAEGVFGRLMPLTSIISQLLPRSLHPTI